MFKELICAVALSGTIGATTPQNSSTDTFYQDVTITETYEYETNEVNSVDDLVVGNIYKFSGVNTFTGTLFTEHLINFNINVSNTTYYNNMSFYAKANDGYYFAIAFSNTNFIVNQVTNDATTGYVMNFSTANINSISFYIIYKGTSNSNVYQYLSMSDYLGEKTITVTPREYDGLFAIFDNFLHERLFSGGILDTTNVTVFNATMSLGQWLSTTTSIVLLCLIVLLLVLLIKFIFKYVGGMMIWRS